MHLARSTLSLQVNTGACARQTGQRSAAVATQHGVKVFAVDDEERRAFAAPRRSIHSSQFSVVFSLLLSFPVESPARLSARVETASRRFKFTIDKKTTLSPFYAREQTKDRLCVGLG